MADFDLVIIGAGPGGYVCALRAAQLKLKTACIEKDKTLGGTCLNVGCIPSKAMLDSSEHFAYTREKLGLHGVMVKDVKLDLATMLKRKDQVVTQLTTGISGLFKKNGVTHIKGFGKITKSANGEHAVEVKAEDGTTKVYTAKNVVIATGSEPTSLPFAPFDGKRIINSTDALTLSQVPQKMVVIGGGAIGLEMGSVWSRLGAKVTVVEYMDRIAALFDKQVSLELQKMLTKQGLEIKTSTKVSSIKNMGSKVVIEMESANGTEKMPPLEADVVLVSVGRRPFTNGLGLEEIGIEKDKQGRVVVNDHFETNKKGIFAIGDCVRGPMLAHKAEEEGVAIAETLAGQHGHVNYDCIPNVIYTWPELASVGLTQEECQSKGLTIKSGTFPFLANGRAKAMMEPEGIVKVISDAKSDRVLGVHIVGPRASDMIAEAVAVMEFGGSAEDIARTCHAHPTLSETLKEAAMAVDKRALHF